VKNIFTIYAVNITTRTLLANIDF